MRLTRRTGSVARALLLALVLYAGSTACGDDPSATPRDPSSSASASTTPTATPTPTATAAPSGSATTGAVGLPEGYPDDEVPVLTGVVTGQSGGAAPDGRQGWVLEVSAVGSASTCLATAIRALEAEGFTEQGRMGAGDTTQVQLTSSEYAVIVSARADGDELCQVGYEVGQVSK